MSGRDWFPRLQKKLHCDLCGTTPDDDEILEIVSQVNAAPEALKAPPSVSIVTDEEQLPRDLKDDLDGVVKVRLRCGHYRYMLLPDIAELVQPAEYVPSLGETLATIRELLEKIVANWPPEAIDDLPRHPFFGESQ